MEAELPTELSPLEQRLSSEGLMISAMIIVEQHLGIQVIPDKKWTLPYSDPSTGTIVRFAESSRAGCLRSSIPADVSDARWEIGELIYKHMTRAEPRLSARRLSKEYYLASAMIDRSLRITDIRLAERAESMLLTVDPVEDDIAELLTTEVDILEEIESRRLLLDVLKDIDLEDYFVIFFDTSMRLALHLLAMHVAIRPDTSLLLESRETIMAIHLHHNMITRLPSAWIPPLHMATYYVVNTVCKELPSPDRQRELIAAARNVLKTCSPEEKPPSLEEGLFRHVLIAREYTTDTGFAELAELWTATLKAPSDIDDLYHQLWLELQYWVKIGCDADDGAVFQNGIRLSELVCLADPTPPVGIYVANFYHNAAELYILRSGYGQYALPSDVDKSVLLLQQMRELTTPSHRPEETSFHLISAEIHHNRWICDQERWKGHTTGLNEAVEIYRKEIQLALSAVPQGGSSFRPQYLRVRLCRCLENLWDLSPANRDALFDEIIENLTFIREWSRDANKSDLEKNDACFLLASVSQIAESLGYLEDPKLFGFESSGPPLLPRSLDVAVNIVNETTRSDSRADRIYSVEVLRMRVKDLQTWHSEWRNTATIFVAALIKQLEESENACDMSSLIAEGFSHLQVLLNCRDMDRNDPVACVTKHVTQNFQQASFDTDPELYSLAGDCFTILAKMTRNLKYGFAGSLAYRLAIQIAGRFDLPCSRYKFELGELYFQTWENGHGSLDLLDLAIKAFQEIVNDAGGLDLVGSSIANSLGKALQQRYYLFSHDLADGDLAIQSWLSFVGDHGLKPTVSAMAFCSIAQLSHELSRRGHDEQRYTKLARDMAYAAIRKMSDVVSRGYGTLDQYDVMKKLSKFTAFGISLTLECDGSPEEAVLLHELGIGVLISTRLETRLSGAQLVREGRSDYLEQLEEQQAKIEDLDKAGKAIPLLNSDAQFLHRRLVRSAKESYQRLLNTIRDTLPDFLLVPDDEDLRIAVANVGPIVLFNVSSIRSDALVVAPGGKFRSLPLPYLTLDLLRQMVADWKTALLTRNSRDPNARKAALETAVSVLASLWDSVVLPVLEHLGMLQPPAEGQPYPRVCWIPGGLLKLLPIHAAGILHGCVEECTMDCIISSYAPSIKALVYAGERGNEIATTWSPDERQRVLFVGMDDTPGESPLPAVKRERQALKELPAGPNRLEVTDVYDKTRENVLKLLPQHEFLHMACHSDVGMDPTMAKIYLEDWEERPLLVEDLMPKSKLGEFAYMAGCSTARALDESLLDEAIHLSSAMLLSGYPSVVGSIWDVFDHATAHITRLIYKFMIDPDTGRLDHRRSAEALHRAVRMLRKASRYPKDWDDADHPLRSAAMMEGPVEEAWAQGFDFPLKGTMRDVGRRHDEGISFAEPPALQGEQTAPSTNLTEPPPSDPFVWAPYIHLGI